MNTSIAESPEKPLWRTILKVAGWIVGIVVALIILAIIVVAVIPDEKYREWINQGVSSATGRSFEIRGDFDLQLGSTLGVRAGDVHLANADWGTNADMVRVGSLDARVALWPILTGTLDLVFHLDDSTVSLETNAEGKNNWTFGKGGGEEPASESADPGSGGGLPLRPLLDVRVTGLDFALLDGAAGSTYEATIDSLTIGEIEELLTIGLQAQVNDAPLRLEGNLGSQDDLLANRSSNVDLKGAVAEAGLTVRGSIGPFVPEFNSDLDIALDSPSVAVFSPFAGLELPDLQGLAVGLTLSSSEGRFGLSDVDLKLDDSTLKLSASGAIADLANLGGIDLQTAISSGEPSALARKFNRENVPELPGSIDVRAHVTGDRDTLAVPTLDATIQGDNVSVMVTGTADNLIGGQGVNLLIDADVGSVQKVAALAGLDLPDLGKLTLDGRLATTGEALKLESLVADLSGGGLVTRFEASADNLLPLLQFDAANPDVSGTGIRIHFSGNTPSTATLSRLTGVDLPDLGVTDIKGRIVSTDGVLKFEHLEASLTGDHANLSLKASVDNLPVLAGIGKSIDVLHDAGISLEIDADSPSVQRLAEIAGVKLPALGELQINGRAVPTDGRLRLETLAVDVGGGLLTADIDGSIKDIPELIKAVRDKTPFAGAGIELGLVLSVPSVDDFSDYIGTDLPDVGNVEVKGRIASGEEHLVLESLDITAAGERLNADLQASIANLATLLEIADNPARIGDSGTRAELQATVPDISRFSDIAGTTLPAVGPVDIRALVVSGNDTLKLESLEVKATGEAANAELKAAIEDLLVLRELKDDPGAMGRSGIRAEIDAAVPSVLALVEKTGIELPDLGELKINGKISGQEDRLVIDTLTADLTGDGKTAHLEASVRDLMTLSGINADLDAHLDSMSVLSIPGAPPMPKTGPWDAIANINAEQGLAGATTIAANIEGNGLTGKVRCRNSGPEQPQGSRCQRRYPIAVDRHGSSARGSRTR